MLFVGAQLFADAGAQGDGSRGGISRNSSGTTLDLSIPDLSDSLYFELISTPSSTSRHRMEVSDHRLLLEQQRALRQRRLAVMQAARARKLLRAQLDREREEQRAKRGWLL
jgi:hypothetical protein